MSNDDPYVPLIMCALIVVAPHMDKELAHKLGLVFVLTAGGVQILRAIFIRR